MNTTFSNLPNGRSDLSISESYEGPDGKGTSSGTMLVYQQPYSLVTGITWTALSGALEEDTSTGIFHADQVLGFSTPASALTDLIAQEATFNYKGAAFDGKDQGWLSILTLK